MARIYYKEKKSLGNKNKHFGMLNIDMFKYYFSAARNLFEGGPQHKTFTLELLSNNLPVFKYVTFWKGDFEYEHEGVVYYLPDAIVLVDKDAENFYFIARIGNQLDCRSMKNNPENHTFIGFSKNIDTSDDISDLETTNKELWNKIDCTLFSIDSAIEQRLEQKTKQNLREPKKIQKSTLSAIGSLASLCGWSKLETQQLVVFLETKETIELTPFSIISFIENYCYHILKKPKLIFMYFDWKEAVEELIVKLEIILQGNYGISEKINFKTDSYTPIYQKGIIEWFNDYLGKYKIEIIHLQTDGDEYLFVVNKIKHREQIRKDIASIGFDTYLIEK